MPQARTLCADDDVVDGDVDELHEEAMKPMMRKPTPVAVAMRVNSRLSGFVHLRKL